jgi:MscS family membrane protein
LALVAGLLALLLGGVGSGVPALALGPGLANAVMPDLRPGRTEAGTENLIPLNRQPFYPELLDASRRWADAPLGGVIGDNPRETLLNFYAVMTRVQRELSAATGSAARDPGVGWSSQAQARISTAEQLFALAVRALDGSAFPQSIRDDMTQEAAIQLKEVLDYVFTHSTVPIEIPDSAGLKLLNSQRHRSSDSWTIPETAITLTATLTGRPGQSGFQFASDTVVQAARMYELIREETQVSQPFATTGFFDRYSKTPGFLAAPKWYLRLPPQLRELANSRIGDQTLFKISGTAMALLLYSWLVLILFRKLLHTYRYYREQDHNAIRPHSWHQDNVAWLRVALTLPVMPLTRLCDYLIGEQINFTGLGMVVLTYLFYICYFIAASLFFFYLLEALGRSLSEWLVHLRGGGSDLQLRRVSNLVMPCSRVLGGLVALILIYRLLIMLGLPPTTVLAFSAVPGLAIGLGASKLLGNMFAGLSIQTDRPVRVGEFCQIGNNLGFITRIGLRSLELQSLESRVTIPNAIADEATIINYSRRQQASRTDTSQALLVDLVVKRVVPAGQSTDLLAVLRRRIGTIQTIEQPLLSLEDRDDEALTLICHGLVQLHDWEHYLRVREQLLVLVKDCVEEVRLCNRHLSVSYSTSAEQLQQLPDLIRRVVERDPKLTLASCRLMTIADFSYDIAFGFDSLHADITGVRDAIDRLNRDLLNELAAAAITIPFPTSLQIQEQT